MSGHHLQARFLLFPHVPCISEISHHNVLSCHKHSKGSGSGAIPTITTHFRIKRSKAFNHSVLKFVGRDLSACVGVIYVCMHMYVCICMYVYIYVCK